MASGDVRQYYLQRKIQLSVSKSSRLQAVAELDTYVKVIVRFTPLKCRPLLMHTHFLAKNRRGEPI